MKFIYLFKKESTLQNCINELKLNNSGKEIKIHSYFDFRINEKDKKTTYCLLKLESNIEIPNETFEIMNRKQFEKKFNGLDNKLEIKNITSSSSSSSQSFLTLSATTGSSQPKSNLSTESPTNQFKNQVDDNEINHNNNKIEQFQTQILSLQEKVLSLFQQKYFNLLVRSHYNDKVIRHVSREKQRIKIARNSIKKNIDQFILRSYKREIAELKLLQNENKIRSWKDNVFIYIGNGNFNISFRGGKPTFSLNTVKSFFKGYRIVIVNESYSTKICHHCAACPDPLIHQHLKMPDCRRFFQRKVEPKQFVTIDKHNSRRANCMYHGTLIRDGSAASNILIISEMGQAYPGIDLDCYSPSYHNTKLSS
ncbi:hypothetical protein ACTFIZ_002768 [Dictyostelium cf. discoideum]